MSNEQLYLALGLPTLVNALFYALLTAFINAKLEAGRAESQALRAEMNARFDAAHQQLLRVEGVLDARLQNVENRLKHLEEKVR